MEPGVRANRIGNFLIRALLGKKYTVALELFNRDVNLETLGLYRHSCVLLEAKVRRWPRVDVHRADMNIAEQMESG